MKILLIDVNYKNSSTGKIVYDLMTQINQNGRDTAAVCYGRGPDTNDANIFKFGFDWETLLHALLTRITGMTGCFSFFSTRRLLHFIDEFQPDVIHLHEPHAYFLNIKPFFDYIRQHRIPLVYTFHCEFAYTGKCGYSYECDRWQSGCGCCPKLKEYPATLILDFTKTMFRQKKERLRFIEPMVIVTPSKWLHDRVQCSFLADKPIQVIHNSINTDTVFKPASPDEIKAIRDRCGIGDRKMVLSVAPDIMNQRKGGKWVLKTAEQLAEQPYVFVMIGATKTEAENVYPDNVIVLERTSNQTELAHYYSAADCFLICSEMENFPTTCVEAVCCGTPVVGFATGGTAETAPAPFGFFCEYGDIKTLCNLLQQQTSEKIAPEAFNVIRDHYSPERMYADYDRVYQTIKKGKH